MKKLPDTYISFHLPEVCPPTVEGMDDPVVEEPPLNDIEADEDWLNDPNPSSCLVKGCYWGDMTGSKMGDSSTYNLPSDCGEICFGFGGVTRALV